MRSFLKLCIIIFTIAFIGLFSLDTLYTWSITETPLYGIRKNRHYDFLIAGDSRTNALHAPYLDIISGFKTINIGNPSFTLEDNWRILRYFFERGNTVDKVLLQVDLRFGTTDKIVKEWEYKPYLVRHEGLLTPRIPFMDYALNNKNIAPSMVAQRFKTAIRNKDLPEKYDSIKTLNDFRPFLYNERLLADNSKKPFFMDKLKSFEKFLKEKGVKQLILFTAPFSPNWFPSQSDTTLYKQRLKEAGYAYYDFSTIYPDTTYFKDYTHIKNNKYLDFCKVFHKTVLVPNHP